MSQFKTIMSKRGIQPFDFTLVSDVEKQDIEKGLENIPSDRLGVILEKIGQDKFVHVAGRSWKQVSRYLRGDRVPSDVLAAISEETGTSIDWLSTGRLSTDSDLRFEERMLRSAIARRWNAAAHPRTDAERAKIGYALKTLYDRLDALVDGKTGGMVNASPDIRKDTMSLSGFIQLPFYRDVAASAGPGALAISQQNDSVIAFAQSFLRDHGATPEQCSVIRSKGDSMAPTIPDASLLIVDHSQTDIANGCIMVISIGDDLLVKRVRRRLDGLVDLVSDNPAYPPETVGRDTIQQLRVVGRVVYFCRVP